MEKSETIAKLAAALVKAQSNIEHASKSSKNPFFKSSYADLTEVIETIKKPLNDNGISFLQILTVEGGQSVVETTLLHESGEFISGKTLVVTSKQNDPQALGSGITYAKRYGLQAMLGLGTEDDDGEKAMGRKHEQATFGKSPEAQEGKLKQAYDIIKGLGKTKNDIDKMRKYVGASTVVSGTLDDLSDDQLDKLLTALKKL